MLSKAQAIRAMLAGKIVIDEEDIKWRYHAGKFEHYHSPPFGWRSEWTINDEDCNNWRLEGDE